MNIERINPNEIEDVKSARKVISELLDCIFEMSRDFKRELSNLSSQNVRTLDFNITKTENTDLLHKGYYTAAEVDEKLSGYQKITS